MYGERSHLAKKSTFAEITSGENKLLVVSFEVSVCFGLKFRHNNITQIMANPMLKLVKSVTAVMDKRCADRKRK